MSGYFLSTEEPEVPTPETPEPEVPDDRPLCRAIFFPLKKQPKNKKKKFLHIMIARYVGLFSFHEITATNDQTVETTMIARYVGLFSFHGR